MYPRREVNAEMSSVAQAINVKQVVPFLHVRDIQKSITFYRDGLHFEMRHSWPADQAIRWCWLTLGGASIMLQSTSKPGNPSGEGRMSLCFMCEDAIAIYRDAIANGLQPNEPYVGNSLWVTTFIDPDGNRVEFESPADVAEGTKLSEVTK